MAVSFLRRAAECKLINKIATFLYEAGREDLPRSAARSFGVFTDSRGNSFELLSGLRDWLKPGWRTMFGDPDVERHITPQVQDESAVAARCSVEQALNFLKTLGFTVKGKKILEIGCFDGTRSFALTSLGAGAVTATDIPEYYLNQKEKTCFSPEEVEEGRKEQLRRFYSGAEVFERVHGLSGLLEPVTFQEDDICDSKLPTGEYDAVFSWEVLEHVRRPAALFQNVARILRPGAAAFHEYNPFFSITGGHSLCTLDFLWGHACLSTEDFHSYLRKFRPGEEEVAMRFFTRNLNRMSYADLRRYVREAGLELVAFLPWYNRNDEKRMSRDVLAHVQALYPTVTAEDLLARNVWVVLSKPV